MKATLERVPPSPESGVRLLEIGGPRFDHPFHFHPEFELTYIVSGFGRRFVGDSVELFHAGEVVLLGPQLPHLFLTDDADSTGDNWARAVVLHFTPSSFGSDFLALPELRGVARLLASAAGGIHFTQSAMALAEPAGGLRQICGELEQLRNLSLAERLLGVISILVKLSRCETHILSHQTRFSGLAAHDMRRVEQVVRYIQQEFRSEVSLAAAAEMVAMTREGFCRFFRRTTGRTLSRYVNEVRVAEACQLLAQTELRVADIAFRCGFETLSNFNHRFAELKGQSPRVYRKQMVGK